MDRSLDEILAEKRSPSPRTDNRRNGRGRRDRDRTAKYPRDGVKKSYHQDPRYLDEDWVHDKFEDHGPRWPNYRHRRDSPGRDDGEPKGTKIRVTNIHYELTEQDLDELFNRIGPIMKLELGYDRAGRSEGIAFVVYESRNDACEAIRQFDGANANGQPIYLTRVGSDREPRQRNPFDTAFMPGKPLEDRISKPPARSLSPDRDVDEAAKRGIDRYVPGSSRRRSPLPSRQRRGRRPGVRREGGLGAGGASETDNGNGGRGGGSNGGGGRRRNPRPKKTAEELDADMKDYFARGSDSKLAPDNVSSPDAAPATRSAAQDDIDMIH